MSSKATSGTHIDEREIDDIINERRRESEIIGRVLTLEDRMKRRQILARLRDGDIQSDKERREIRSEYDRFMEAMYKRREDVIKESIKQQERQQRSRILLRSTTMREFRRKSIEREWIDWKRDWRRRLEEALRQTPQPGRDSGENSGQGSEQDQGSDNCVAVPMFRFDSGNLFAFDGPTPIDRLCQGLVGLDANCGTGAAFSNVNEGPKTAFLRMEWRTFAPSSGTFSLQYQGGAYHVGGNVTVTGDVFDNLFSRGHGFDDSVIWVDLEFDIIAGSPGAFDHAFFHTPNIYTGGTPDATKNESFFVTHGLPSQVFLQAVAGDLVLIRLQLIVTTDTNAHGTIWLNIGTFGVASNTPGNELYRLCP